MKTPAGVSVHGTSIRISFTYRGARCRPIFSRSVTKANLKAAERLRHVVLDEIDKGTFDYATRFPNCPNAEKYVIKRQKAPTLSAALDAYLAIKTVDLAKSTIDGYRRKAKIVRRLDPENARGLDTYTGSDLDQFLARLELANKTKNEVLIILRGVFTGAFNDGVIAADPTSHIENKMVIKDEPDPFTRDELCRIYAVETWRKSEMNMITLACNSGLALSEYFGIGWEDFDESRRTISVQRNLIDGRYKCTKTKGRKRILELNDVAFEAILRQKEYTANREAVTINEVQADNRTVRNMKHRPMFVSSSTHRVFSYKSFCDNFWRPTLATAKVRYRPPNHCRHTFASQMLTMGVPIEWLRAQLGHTSDKMIREHYAKWIKEDAPNLAALVSRMMSQGLDIIDVMNRVSD